MTDDVRMIGVNDDANCQQPGVDPDWWHQEATAHAVSICNGDNRRPPCPVREPCLKYALANREEGVWGGLTATQRDTLARKNGTPYARPSLIGLVPHGMTRQVPHGTAVGVENHRRHYQPLCAACNAYDTQRRETVAANRAKKKAAS